MKAKLFSQVIVRAKHIHSNNFDATSDSSIVAKKVISNDSLCSSLKNSDDIEIVKILRNEAHLISGFLGGIGGAIYAQSISVNFSVTTIVGPGFIALAAMIFGKWNPIGAMLSSLFFGLSQSLAVIGSQLPFLQGVPAVYLQIAPYVLTILVLAAFFGKAVAPKADGINYIKSK
ncbi:ABC transporter%2C membrane-spanning permease [Streptococcus pneumoniae]|nr:ABC transporter%2C membrane-spanning permease [Streptococcus pneumoniae]